VPTPFLEGRRDLKGEDFNSQLLKKYSDSNELTEKDFVEQILKKNLAGFETEISGLPPE